MCQPIPTWPESDRPREKLIEHSPATVSSAELLAILLGTGDASSGQSALDHGRTLVTRFGDYFRELEEVSITELCDVKGIGPAKVTRIKTALEITNCFSQEEIRRGESFRLSADVFNHYREQLGSLKKEEFQVPLLWSN